jgi:transposase
MRALAIDDSVIQARPERWTATVFAFRRQMDSAACGSRQDLVSSDQYDVWRVIRLYLAGRPAAPSPSTVSALRATIRRGVHLHQRRGASLAMGHSRAEARRRRAEQAESGLTRTPSSRTIARLMTIGRDRLSKAETVTVATIETSVPLLVEAREIIAAFQSMIRSKSLTDLQAWIERAKTSLVASFAKGVMKDRDAVAAAIEYSWSNGQTEGQITKLKLVKRQMYGRGKIDLLEACVIGPT